MQFQDSWGKNFARPHLNQQKFGVVVDNYNPS
jgi:hypothetical protein